MKTTALSLLLAGALVAGSQVAPAKARDGRNAALFGGLAAGVAAGAILAAPRVYAYPVHPVAPPPPPVYGYDPAYGYAPHGYARIEDDEPVCRVVKRRYHHPYRGWVVYRETVCH